MRLFCIAERALKATLFYRSVFFQVSTLFAQLELLICTSISLEDFEAYGGLCYCSRTDARHLSHPASRRSCVSFTRCETDVVHGFILDACASRGGKRTRRQVASSFSPKQIERCSVLTLPLPSHPPAAANSLRPSIGGHSTSLRLQPVCRSVRLFVHGQKAAAMASRVVHSSCWRSTARW